MEHHLLLCMANTSLVPKHSSTIFSNRFSVRLGLFSYYAHQLRSFHVISLVGIGGKFAASLWSLPMIPLAKSLAFCCYRIGSNMFSLPASTPTPVSFDQSRHFLPERCRGCSIITCALFTPWELFSYKLIIALHV